MELPMLFQEVNLSDFDIYVIGRSGVCLQMPLHYQKQYGLWKKYGLINNMKSKNRLLLLCRLSQKN